MLQEGSHSEDITHVTASLSLRWTSVVLYEILRYSKDEVSGSLIDLAEMPAARRRILRRLDGQRHVGSHTRVQKMAAQGRKSLHNPHTQTIQYATGSDMSTFYPAVGIQRVFIRHWPIIEVSPR